MEEKLREYAKLLIEVGLNVQKGQAVVIRCPVECAYFARLCAAAAYNVGCREPDIYGKEDYAALCARIYEHAQSRGVAVECFQSNHEGAIIDAIQEADTAFDGIVINPGAYTHYSYAIHDALKAVSIPAVEVHMSDIQKREEFRHLSVTAPACIAQIRGHGFESYTMAIDMLAKLNPEEK